MWKDPDTSGYRTMEDWFKAHPWRGAAWVLSQFFLTLAFMVVFVGLPFVAIAMLAGGRIEVAALIVLTITLFSLLRDRRRGRALMKAPWHLARALLIAVSALLILEWTLEQMFR